LKNDNHQTTSNRHKHAIALSHECIHNKAYKMKLSKVQKSSAMKRFVENFYDDKYLAQIRNKTEFDSLTLYFKNFKNNYICSERGRCRNECFRCIEFRRRMCKKYHSKIDTQCLSADEAKAELLKRVLYEGVFDKKDRDWGHSERIYILTEKAVTKEKNNWLHGSV
jgi:hypothetical protein